MHNCAVLYLYTTIAMGGDVTVASAASQQSNSSQSQSSTDSSQVDGTQPVLNTKLTPVKWMGPNQYLILMWLFRLINYCVTQMNNCYCIIISRQLSQSSCYRKNATRVV